MGSLGVALSEIVTLPDSGEVTATMDRGPPAGSESLARTGIATGVSTEVTASSATAIGRVPVATSETLAVAVAPLPSPMV